MKVTAPGGFDFTDQNVGSDDTIDSDVGAGGVTGVICVGEGENVSDVDAGLKDAPQPGSISGTYFIDSDRDGTDDGAAAGDMDIAGKTVMLFEADGVTPATDIDGTPAAAVQTDAQGNYCFENPSEGDYVVMFEGTDGKTFIAPNQGNPADDSYVLGADGKTAQVTVTAGQDTSDIDAGVETIPGAINGRIFLDRDCDNTEFRKGGGFDEGIVGKTVQLIDVAGNVVAETMTGTNGVYSFSVEPGAYRIKFPGMDGFKFSAKDVFTLIDNIDSDADAIGLTDPVHVAPGQTVIDVDAGLKPIPGSLSGRYFMDTDRDDVDDGQAVDPGVSGIVVALLDASGAGVLDGAGNPVTTTTGADGSYGFRGLIAGTYGVPFSDPANVNAGKVLVAPNQGGDDSIDSDAIGTAQSSTITGIVVTAGQDTPDNDVGVFSNAAPVAIDDAAEGCADEDIVVDLSDNFSDRDSASVSITEIGGVAIADGQTVVVDGVTITRDGDSFSFDAEAAFAHLDINESAVKSFAFTVEDSDGAHSTGSIDLTIKGDANTASSLLETVDFFSEYQIVSGLNQSPTGQGGFDIKISGIGADARFDGQVFDAYCLSFLDPAEARADFDFAPRLTGEVFGAQGAAPADVLNAGQVGSLNGQSAAENLGLVKWIVAQDFEGQGFTGWEVQFAIWELTDNFNADAAFAANAAFGDLADTDFNLAEAATHGEGFDFDLSGKVGAIIDPNPQTDTNSQPFIFAFDPEEYDCIC